MDLSNLMMLLNFLLAFYIVYADVIREDGYNNYEGQFTVENKGRMLRVLMSFRNIEPEECASYCVRHLRCRTYNYHHGRKDCELTDEDFDEMDVDTITHGWYNYATPKRVNGGWSSWMYYTECTKTCGDGTREQYRDCDSPTPEHGGADCYGKMIRSVKCDIRRCPVNGNWSRWINETTCSKPCGSGTLIQMRDCDSPKPAHGGDNCTGKDTQTVRCNTHKCPVVNVALGKVATQSSTLRNDNPLYSSLHAVDGNTNTIAWTKREANPWWEVDLGNIKLINEIRLNTRVHSAYNKGLLVESRTKKTENWRSCNNIGDVKKSITKFQCYNKTTNARFVRIRAMKKCYLSFLEVEIFGD